MGDLPRIFYANKIRDLSASITPLSEDTSYPAVNLVDDNYGSVYRSTAADSTTQTLVFDFGTAVAISAIALGNINFRSTATVKIQGNASDSWGTPTVDDTIDCGALVAANYRRSLYHELTGGSATLRYWRLTVLDDGNPDGFLEIGEAFLGVPVELSDGFTDTNTRRLNRLNVRHTTDYGQNFVYPKDWAWVMDWNFQNVVESVRDELRLLNQTQAGDAIPFFVVPDPLTTPMEALYVRMVNDLEENRISENVYNLRAQFMEEMPGLTVPK